MMRFGIAVDHGGFELKVQRTAALDAAGYEVADFGAHELVTGDDYEVTRGLAACAAAGLWPTRCPPCGRR